jgi:hypothetical protein
MTLKMAIAMFVETSENCILRPIFPYSFPFVTGVRLSKDKPADVA